MTRRIAVIGAGKVGTALAQGLSAGPHQVTVGVRDPANARHESLRQTMEVTASASAVDGAEVVVLAVPVAAIPEVLPSLGLHASQTLVDATNAVGTPVPDGFPTVADYVGSLTPEGVAVVKAFNTIGAEHLSNGQIGGNKAFLPIAGDASGRPQVIELAEGLGFDVADLGDRDAFSVVEDHARLWIHLAFRCGWGRDFGFAVARKELP